ncbi:hypothetical protein PIB30_044658 [Stylosanthes scabra]|uniref:Uncharacterized protein n=1 Tax=Stylosanthes scabra TaxID=79078 RepID=A0ABU6ZEM4_9FABA|nr:hypothetical protein [Stylosanthes scabra]
MAWRCGSLSRSLISAARTVPRPSSVPRFHNPSSPSPSLRSHILHSRRPLFTLPRNVGALGCTQSLMPLHSVDAAARLTSHISVESRACCELSQGT